MRPYPEEVLRAIQSGIVAHFAPALTTKYGQAQFAFSMLLFGIVARDYDSAVPDLLDANRALRDLLAEAALAVGEIDSGTTAAGANGVDAAAIAYARDLLGALPAQAATLRLSALREEHDALRTVVAQLAPLIEPAGDLPHLAPLAPARERMYAWFSADARRRIFPILTA